jgi:hypothetical protein
MSSTLAREVFDLIEAASSRSSSAQFELAYQARVAIDDIRFAIRLTEEASTADAQVREAQLQLLDALDRLEAADRTFQRCFRERRSDGVGVGGLGA